MCVKLPPRDYRNCAPGMKFKSSLLSSLLSLLSLLLLLLLLLLLSLSLLLLLLAGQNSTPVFILFCWNQEREEDRSPAMQNWDNSGPVQNIPTPLLACRLEFSFDAEHVSHRKREILGHSSHSWGFFSVCMSCCCCYLVAYVLPTC